MIRKLVLVLSIPVLFIFFSLSSVIFNEAVYAAELSPQQFSMSPAVIGFLAGSAASLPVVFNAREIAHLLDVKLLIQRIALAGWILFFAFILLLFFEKHRLFVFFSGILLTFIAIASLYLAPFSLSFNIFHRLFFKDGTWLFSQYDTLVNTYSFEFFYNIAVRIFTRVFVLCFASLLVLAGLALCKRRIYQKTTNGFKL